MKIWIYHPRSGPIRAFHDFDKAREAQDLDNRGTLEDILLDNPDVDWGSTADSFWIDDGGSIDLVEVE